VRRLIRLYPRAWRERYGEELTALVDDLANERGRLRLAFDIGRGALDAHLHRRHEVRRYLSDTALRRGAYDGLILAAVLAVVAFLTVVVFPPGPNESDDDPEYLVQLLAAYVLLAIALMAVGAHARRRSASPYAGLKAGAAAGLVIAVMVTLTYLVINNAFFPVVSQQHDKRVAFAASGWTSMRAFINMQTVRGLFVIVPLATAVGAVLGFLGAALLARTRLAPAREDRR
jgi:hypothetical protein